MTQNDVFDDDLEVLDADDIAELEQEEVEVDADATASTELPTAGYDSDVVVLDGREFAIEPPTVGIVLRIIKCFGLLGVRGERVALRSLQALSRGSMEQIKVSGRAALFGMLAALQEEDLITLGSAVLQFESEKEGRQWLREHELRLAPLVRATFLNLAKSEDLRDSLQDFFVGLGMVDGIWSKLNLDQ